MAATRWIWDVFLGIRLPSRHNNKRARHTPLADLIVFQNQFDINQKLWLVSQSTNDSNQIIDWVKKFAFNQEEWVSAQEGWH